MNPIIPYLLSYIFLSSLHLIGMSIDDIISSEESADEPRESTNRARNTLYKMDLRFITHPQTDWQFKKRLLVPLQRHNAIKTTPAVSPVGKHPVSIAEVDLTVDALNHMEHNPTEQGTHRATPIKQPVKKRTPQAQVSEESLIRMQLLDIDNNLAIFMSEDGSRYHIRCDRCSSIDKPFFISHRSFPRAYGNVRTHLKNTHKLSKKQLSIEVPRRNK